HRRHTPRFARIGAFAPENSRPRRNIRPYHARVGATLRNTSLNPCNRLLINNVDTTVKTVIGSDDEHVHPRLHLGAVVEHISDRNHRLFGDEWDRTHEILQLAVQGSTFNANWEHESSTLNVEPGI